jgi:hypothetical protein
MKTVPKKRAFLIVTGLVLLVMLAGCKSSGSKPEEAVPAPGAPGSTTGKEPPSAGPAQPGVAQPGVAAPPAKPGRPGPETAYFVHTVKWRGESVSIVAGWYTGDIQNWKILAEHNPDINPNRIFEGNKIRIPEYLMKTKAPMPKEYVDGFYTKPPRKESGKPASPSTPPADNGDEPKLFGPK